MTKLIAQTYAYTNNTRAYMTYVLLGLSALMAVIYAANVYAVVSRTVAIKQISNQATEISAVVQALDGKYLELSNRITPESIRAQGMNQGTVSAYISRTATLGKVAISGYE